MKNLKLYIPAILLGIAMILLITFIANYSSGKKVEKREQARVKIVNQDSINTAIAKRFIAREDRIIDSMARVNEKNRTFYASQVKADTKIEKEYRAAPTLPLCDSVIDSKNNLIGTLEQIVTDQDTAIAAAGRKASLLTGLVDSQRETIVKLNQGWQESNNQLGKTSKPKRWAVVATIGYGVQLISAQPIRPGPVASIGIARTLIRF